MGCSHLFQQYVAVVAFEKLRLVIKMGSCIALYAFAVPARSL